MGLRDLLLVPWDPPKDFFSFEKKNSSKCIFCSIFVNFWAFGPNFWQMLYFLKWKLSSRFTQIGPGTPSGGYSNNPTPQIGLNWVYTKLGEILSNCFSFWLILNQFATFFIFAQAQVRTNPGTAQVLPRLKWPQWPQVLDQVFYSILLYFPLINYWMYLLYVKLLEIKLISASNLGWKTSWFQHLISSRKPAEFSSFSWLKNQLIPATNLA